jgi:hypothetical protein
MGTIQSRMNRTKLFLSMCLNILRGLKGFLLSSCSPKQQSHTSSPLTLSLIPFFILCFCSISNYCKEYNIQVALNMKLHYLMHVHCKNEKNLSYLNNKNASCFPGSRFQTFGVGVESYIVSKSQLAT